MIGLGEEEPAFQDQTNILHRECREQIAGIDLLHSQPEQ